MGVDDRLTVAQGDIPYAGDHLHRLIYGEALVLSALLIIISQPG